MSIIHVTTASGQSSQYEEQQVRMMLNQGLLTDALYWKEGMKDWEPINSLFGERPHVSSSSIHDQTSRHSPAYTFTKDPSTLTQALKVMLWVQLGACVISMLSDFGQMSLAGSGNITVESAAANDSRQQTIGFLYLGVYIATAVVFLRWIHRANLNCRGFGAAGMKFSPAWSIGCYFVPFLNLVRPYQAMKEIWQVSLNPAQWTTQIGSALLGWWWTLWLISGFLGQMSFRMAMRVDSPSSLEAATTVSILSSLVEIPLIFVAFSMVSKISAMQRNLIGTTA
jgi:hypothetical protein